ncbi:branched-chain amino acid ABC transporter permease [Deferribacter autotrophicus]|uniref:Branched-chain amino acid ABC transporter permease n=1 Tax=Deferribacter autotrophicus TaxID=500465 RepID=A0A5A8F1V1_9BACT|nr:branched-chain amino acid ABC transporter permease [Deferribacter autotrophicus]KAA0256856.1 branched-chain amino acid ABC transporter permease [Deferribacter autotrophicus]
MMFEKSKDYLMILIVYILLFVLSFVVPEWLSFILKISLAKGIVVVGIVLLMRMGLVSFGQGFFYGIGGYVVGLLINNFMVYEINLILIITIITVVLVSVITGLILCKYRDIFFAMFTMALSMILYALIVKIPYLGSTDGFNIDKVTVFGVTLIGNIKDIVLISYCLVLSMLITIVNYKFFNSEFGFVAFGIKENEIRVEYLGGNVFKLVYANYIFSSILAGIGGALVALVTGHVDPDLAYWSTSGEFVFIGLMSGIYNVFGPLFASIVYELIRTYAYNYFPYLWQLILGISLLIIIIFLPNGILSVFKKFKKVVNN